MKKVNRSRPLEAGLDSEPRLVGVRLGKLLDALDGVNGNVIEDVPDGVVGHCRIMKQNLIECLKEDGWNVHWSNNQKKFKVWPKDE